MMLSTHEGWALTRPTVRNAAEIAGWSGSIQEAGYWCASAHPFPATAITAWWADEDVRPCLLLDPSGEPVAYGELWVDDNEVELARLMVDPERRGEGIGRRMIGAMLELARAEGHSNCIIRVAPGNEDALGAFRLWGFRDIDESTAAEWNQEQDATFHWLERPNLSSVSA